MRKKIIFLITLLSILLMTSGAFAISVRVNVSNASKGERLSDYPFKLLAVNLKKTGGHEILRAYELRTGPSGIFEGVLDVSSAEAITGEVSYSGVVYYSPPVLIKKQRQDYTLNFNVYEITDRMETVEIPRRTLMITPYDDKTVVVYDTIDIENNSRLTYVGGYNDKLKINQAMFIPLPASYSLVSVVGTDREGIFTLSQGVVSQNKIPPGKSTILLEYFLKSDIGIFDLSFHGEDYSPPAKQISVFFADSTGWQVNSSNLGEMGKRRFEGDDSGTYSLLEGRDLRTIDLRVTGPSYRGVFSCWQVSILAAFILAGSGIFIMKDKIYRWNLMREKKRLEGILAGLEAEAVEEDLSGYYMTFRKVLEKRKGAIQERLGS